jgi:uncharacterized protein YbjT (DUF2867 family)
VHQNFGVTSSFSKETVGVLGATSFVGKSLLPLLTRSGFLVHAYSRHPSLHDEASINWLEIPPLIDRPSLRSEYDIKLWVCVAPIWVLPEYLSWLKNMGARRVVVLSSTSRFTKTHSSDLSEQQLVSAILKSEQTFTDWADLNGIAWIILRPTLIYGYGLDKNVSEIARFIRRFAFFPVFGSAHGLRQPVHVDDVAQACLAALNSTISNRAYSLSGGSTLSYREMVCLIFKALGHKPLLLRVPLLAFTIAVSLLRWLPRFRNWTPAMAERMNSDMIFDHAEAQHDLGFNPRPFEITPQDLPN